MPIPAPTHVSRLNPQRNGVLSSREQSRCPRNCKTVGVAREFRYVRAGAQYVAYEVFGEGPLDLVIAPGYMSNLEQNWTWPPYVRFLGRLSSFAQ